MDAASPSTKRVRANKPQHENVGMPFLVVRERRFACSMPVQLQSASGTGQQAKIDKSVHESLVVGHSQFVV